jgi:hypothetical protein
MNQLTDTFFKDSDITKFLDMGTSVKSLADIEEEIQNTLEGSMFELNDTVVNFAPEDELSATLKAMLLSQWGAQNARTESDRDIYLDNFVVFAKSYANVCLQAVKDSVVKS